LGQRERGNAAIKERRGTVSSIITFQLIDESNNFSKFLGQCEKYGYEFNGKIDFWDFRYFMTRIEEIKYSMDHEALKQYFPVEKVSLSI